MPAAARATVAEAPRLLPTPPIVVGYSPFSSKFSPFFSSTAYDQDAWFLTQIQLYPTTRLGEVVYKGIDGESFEYNGTEYTYTGPANIEVTENKDGSVDYDITLRDDLTFSDGEKVTIDDLIFSIYVECDPTYDGAATLFSAPIEGLEEYRSGMDTLANLISAAGRDNTDFTYWTEKQQKAYWKATDEAAKGLAQEIVDYCGENELNDKDDVKASAANWGYELADGATIDDFATALLEAYENNVAAAIGVENAGSSVEDLFPTIGDYQVGVETGKSAAKIKGIERTGDYSMRIHATKVDATLIYQLQVAIAPLHYYGDVEQFDFKKNKFGFPKGDLSLVRAKTTQPVGAGPYKFVKFKNGVITYDANESYFKGAPKTAHVNFREMQDVDKLNGVVTGTIDITDPSFTKDTAQAIEKANGGEITGDKITTSTVDNLGYGYIGINSNNVSVGGEGGSDASKNLRKGIATILAAYRDVAIDSYYGDTAEVINYPISNTSWAAPHATDPDYRVAFSTDVEGNDIYTSDMSADDKYEAAKQAALGFFEAAGYTVKDGKLTAAPKGAKLEYEVLIPADGSGDHPSFMILTEAKKTFDEIGMKLVVNDLSNSADLWTKLDAQQAEIWCAAWGASLDPDMYQVYYSDIANGGKEPGGDNSKYQIQDEELDNLIVEARASTDQEYRKQVYKACLDIIIDWACEIPVYQRQNAIIFSTERVNIDSVTPDITTFYPWLNEIEKVQMN
ncbi:MAG: ABC transporter substrate-binding protein [Coriobacteriales bacterium]|nr:ABC transporter substrate-binding protein [Coriobacteriales bacterium]